MSQAPVAAREVQVLAGSVPLAGTFAVPARARGVVLFAHGSGSSRHSPRNRAVARELQEAGLATLLFDLLTAQEEAVDEATGQWRFDLGLLARRLAAATDWVAAQPATREMAQGYFGASTGGGAALVAAAAKADVIRAVVSRGGRPDLAGAALPRVSAPTLLIVGGADVPVIEMNREALGQLRAPAKLEIVPGASHLFEEPGALGEVARLARDWFLQYLGPSDRQQSG